ncbi:hypothetical protein ACIBI5_54205, partial [Nonomuraea sp. NPDC050540]
RWSACMARQGFRYPDPLTAITDRQWSTNKIGAQEIRTARADVRCKENTGLVDVWAEAESRIQRRAIRTHPTEFHAFKAVKARQLDVARDIIARRAPSNQKSPPSQTD